MTATVTREEARDLVDRFAAGWARARVDDVLAVFAEDAVFLETPHSAPLTGKSAIRGWWADVPYHQAEITVTTGEIYLAGPWFSTEFRARFRRRRTGEWVDARGALFCETAEGLISELRMYWHRAAG